MNFKNYCRKQGLLQYLMESTEFNELGETIFGRNFLKNKQEYSARGLELNKGDETYSADWEGENWIYVSNYDDTTLKLAFLDGANDANKIKYPYMSYDKIATESNLDELLHSSGKLLRDYEIAKKFIDKYISASKNGIKVYRGYSFTKEEFKKYLNIENPTDDEILEICNNTKKMFNSFSVNKLVSDNFVANKENINIVISGLAYPEDINFAFTMYLIGKNGTVGEEELNINSLRKLKDLKIEDKNI